MLPSRLCGLNDRAVYERRRAMMFTFAQILSLTLTNLIRYALLGLFLIIVGKVLIRTWFTEKENYEKRKQNPDL